MRNKDGRRGRAPIRHGAARRVPLLLTFCLAVATAGSPALASASDAAHRPWTVRALAADTGCVVLDDGRNARLLCTGERVDPPGIRLLRVESDAAVVGIDVLLDAPLTVRLDRGASIDVDRMRARARESTGPRPGWIEVAPNPRPRSGDLERP